MLEALEEMDRPAVCIVAPGEAEDIRMAGPVCMLITGAAAKMNMMDRHIVHGWAQAAAEGAVM